MLFHRAGMEALLCCEVTGTRTTEGQLINMNERYAVYLTDLMVSADLEKRFGPISPTMAMMKVWRNPADTTTLYPRRRVRIYEAPEADIISDTIPDDTSTLPPSSFDPSFATSPTKAQTSSQRSATPQRRLKGVIPFLSLYTSSRKRVAKNRKMNMPSQARPEDIFIPPLQLDTPSDEEAATPMPSELSLEAPLPSFLPDITIMLPSQPPTPSPTIDGLLITGREEYHHNHNDQQQNVIADTMTPPDEVTPDVEVLPENLPAPSKTKDDQLDIDFITDVAPPSTPRGYNLARSIRMSPSSV
jgi:hypothetical protein